MSRAAKSVHSPSTGNLAESAYPSEREGFSSRLSEVCQGLSYTAVAELVGGNGETTRRYLKGHAVSIEFVATLCLKLNVSIEWLIYGRGFRDAAGALQPVLGMLNAMSGFGIGVNVAPAFEQATGLLRLSKGPLDGRSVFRPRQVPSELELLWQPQSGAIIVMPFLGRAGHTWQVARYLPSGEGSFGFDSKLEQRASRLSLVQGDDRTARVRHTQGSDGSQFERQPSASVTSQTLMRTIQPALGLKNVSHHPG